MKYKCFKCGNIVNRMPEYCPKCGEKNTYLPTQFDSKKPFVKMESSKK